MNRQKRQAGRTAKRRAAKCLVVGLATNLLLPTGCGDSPPVYTTEHTGTQPNNRTREMESDKHTLRHSFGVVPPTKPVACVFTLSNGSSEPWTFSQFITTCGCTVAELSDAVVPPGGSTKVTLNYRPPPEVGNDRRSVELLFREPSAPRIRLQIDAQVREPVSLFPVRVKLPRAMYGRTHVVQVFVGNYTSTDQPPPKLVGSPSWLSAGDASPEPIPPGETALRQYWTVPVTINAAHMPPGSHVGEIRLAAGSLQEAGPKTVVEVGVVPPLEPTPSQLFFGGLHLGGQKTVTFSVRASDGISLEGVRVGHDLPGKLEIVQTRASANVLTFTATLTPSAAGSIRGVVTVRPANDGIPPTRLPVLAQVSADESE